MDENTISVSRIFKLETDSKLKAFADVSFSGIVIKGFSVVDGEKGLFVSMPRHRRQAAYVVKVFLLAPGL